MKKIYNYAEKKKQWLKAKTEHKKNVIFIFAYII
jgi:hypothetical protein